MYGITIIAILWVISLYIIWLLREEKQEEVMNNAMPKM